MNHETGCNPISASGVTSKKLLGFRSLFRRFGYKRSLDTCSRILIECDTYHLFIFYCATFIMNHRVCLTRTLNKAVIFAPIKNYIIQIITYNWHYYSTNLYTFIKYNNAHINITIK